MCKFYLAIFFIIGANLTINMQTSGTEQFKCVCDWQNVSLSFTNIFEHNLNEIQKNLMERTEQIIDQKFASISEDHKNSVLNINKLQTSVDLLNEKHKDTSSTLITFGHQLDAIQKILLQMEAQNTTLQEETQNSTLEKETQNLADDCTDLYNSGLNVSKKYLLQKYNRTVLCDMETNDGGWLVVQRRKNVTKQVNFNRGWDSYKDGFGDLGTEFWIGNEFLHRITNHKSYELRIDMEDFEKGPFYATYSEFRVGNETSGYPLHIGGYEGNTADSLSYSNNTKFSTLDRDNDIYSNTNCAKEYSGGFWFNDCSLAHLNGVFPTVPDKHNLKLIRWFHKRGNLILNKVEIKIRPKKEEKIAV